MTIFVMLLFVMLGVFIKNSRIKLELSIKDLAANIGIDSSLLSRIEGEKRLPNENTLNLIAVELGLAKTDLIKKWLEDKAYNVLKPYPNFAEDVLKAMETRIEYLQSERAFTLPELPRNIIVLLKTVDDLKTKWQNSLPIEETQKRKLKEHFAIEYTHESNKIEGNTLSLQETFLVISKGLTIAGKPIAEHLEAINHGDAIEFIEELVDNKMPFNEHALKSIHNLILKGIDRKNAGVYRSVSVRIGGSKHIPPEPLELNHLMQDYFLHYNAQKDVMHPVLLAAEMHERLASIHPFIDGNGRTARLVMNLILQQHGYSTAIFKGGLANRLEYYEALEAVQLNANPIPFYELTIKAVISSLEEHLKLV